MQKIYAPIYLLLAFVGGGGDGRFDSHLQNTAGSPCGWLVFLLGGVGFTAFQDLKKKNKKKNKTLLLEGETNQHWTGMSSFPNPQWTTKRDQNDHLRPWIQTGIVDEALQSVTTVTQHLFWLFATHSNALKPQGAARKEAKRWWKTLSPDTHIFLLLLGDRRSSPDGAHRHTTTGAAPLGRGKALQK